MTTTKLKEELYKLINEGDESFVKTIHQMATEYMVKTENDKMMLEAEEDIKAGRVHTIKEVRAIVESWKES